MSNNMSNLLLQKIGDAIKIYAEVLPFGLTTAKSQLLNLLRTD